MSNQVKNNPDHDEIMSLLPWFVNQTLEGHEKDTVAKHVQHCDQCQDEILHLTSLNEMIQGGAEKNYHMHADVEKDLACVMDRINTKSDPISAMDSDTSSLQQKSGGLIAFIQSLSIPQWGATALASVFVAVIGFQLFYVQPDDNYSVLSSSQTEGSSMKLSVEVSPTDNQEQLLSKIQLELETISQKADIETEKDGKYIITFKDSISVNELHELVTDLISNTPVNRVEILP